MPPLISERVHGLRSASRLDPRSARGIDGVETTTSRVLCGHSQVQPEFLFQVGVAPARKQRSPETVHPFAKEAHAISLPHASPWSSVWMMPAIRPQASFSLAS